MPREAPVTRAFLPLRPRSIALFSEELLGEPARGRAPRILPGQPFLGSRGFRPIRHPYRTNTNLEEKGATSMSKLLTALIAAVFAVTTTGAFAQTKDAPKDTAPKAEKATPATPPAKGETKATPATPSP